MSVRLRTKWLWVRVQSQSLKTSGIAAVLSKDFLDIQATIEYVFTLKRVRDMIRTYSQDYLSSNFIYIVTFSNVIYLIEQKRYYYYLRQWLAILPAKFILLKKFRSEFSSIKV